LTTGGVDMGTPGTDAEFVVPSRTGARLTEVESDATATTAARPATDQVSGPARTQPLEHGQPPAPGWGLPVLVLVIGMFMSILDTSIVNVAIPAMRQDFGTSTENIQWVSTSYALTEGVVVPTSAWLGARMGLKRLYLWSLTLFLVASALCGMAGNLGSLVFFRILQAMPGGIIPVVCLTILYQIVPANRLGVAMGLYGLGALLAPGIGPSVGGYFVEHMDWRLIFYVNVPIGVAGVIAAVVVLPERPRDKDRPFDLAGFGCIAGGLFALLLALEKGTDWGWTSYPVVMLFLASTNLLALFVVIELHVDHPLLNVRVFSRLPFVNAMVLISVMFIGMFVVLFYIPLFLQVVQGLTPSHTGLALLPQAGAMAVFMGVGGKLYDLIGARWPAVIGLLMAGGGLMLLSQITVDVTRGTVILGMTMMSAGMALGMMPIMAAALSTLPGELADSGSAFNTLTQRISGAFGLAGMTSLITANRTQFMADRSALLSESDPRLVELQARGPAGLLPLWQQLSVSVQTQAYSSAFVIAAGMAMAAAVLALRLPSGPPTGGMDRPIAH
jgi:EmrB/QacA subfamily drug resistance transporter